MLDKLQIFIKTLEKHEKFLENLSNSYNDYVSFKEICFINISETI